MRFWLYSSKNVSEVKSTLTIELVKSSKQNLLNGVSNESSKVSITSCSDWRICKVQTKFDVIYQACLKSTSLFFLDWASCLNQAEKS